MKYFSVLLLGAVMCNYAHAQYQITVLKTSHVSIFKNGTFFVTKEGEAKVENGMFIITPPSNALNGTFWLAAGKENKITSISVKPDTVKVARPVDDIPEFIQSSIGKNITIHLPSLTGGGAPREIKGAVLNFYAMNQMIKIKTPDGKTMMCSVASAFEVYNDGSNADTYQLDSLVRMAKVKLQNNVDEINVSTVALQTGMSWVPSYFLKLNDDKTARLELKATIGNISTEPVIDASVDLVIGNPQLFYQTKLDDVSTDYLQTHLFDYNRYQQNNFQLNNLYSNNSAGASTIKVNAYELNAAKAFNEILPEMATYNTEGEKTNDLYYFNLGNLSIEPYSKTIVPLLTTEIGYKDLYELDIEDQNSYWSNRVLNNDPNRVFDTWHVLKIENTGKAPFTTGPIFVIDQKERPLAQDEMKYTARGATAKIHLSKAIDVVTKNTEEVVSSEIGKKSINGHTYSTTTIKGKLEITNYQTKSIKINISKMLTGKIVGAGSGIVTIIAKYNGYYNPTSVVKWEKEIDANDKIELEYQYEVLIW